MKRILFVVVVLCLLLTDRSSANDASAKLNFVFILMDDMGWTDLGCYGSQFYQSPNIDKLARQGMKFTQAYAACNVCSPTRASILTGKYPARLHLTTYLPGRADHPDQKLARPQINQQLPLEEITIAEALQPAGYLSGAFGKWHLGGKDFQPEQQGFDVYEAGNSKAGPDSQEPGKGEYGVTEAALKFINDNKDKPFFVYLPFYSVHVPLAAKQELVGKYQKLVQPGATHTNAIYAAMIESVDTQIGRLLSKLDELKLTEKTVVIFTSDNGGLNVHETPNTPATSNAPLREGKGYLYEGGHRVPLIIRWPNVVKEGVICSNVVASIDFFPTLLEIAGIQLPGRVDGRSMLPLLKGKTAVAPRPVFWHYPHYSNQGGSPGGAIRDGDFKLIENYEDGSWELYDLRADPGETNNLASARPEKAMQLGVALDSWRRSVGAQMMLPNPGYDPAAPIYRLRK